MSKKQNDELQLVIDDKGGRWQPKGKTPSTRRHNAPTGKFKVVDWLKPFYSVKKEKSE